MNPFPFHHGRFVFHMTAAILFLLLCLPAAGTADEYARLKGLWQCEEEGVQGTLEFQSRERLLFNGEASRYVLLPGTVRVPGDYGPVDYAYRFQGEALVILSPDGSVMQCRKAKKGPSQAKPSATTQSPSGDRPTVQKPKGPITGNESDQASLLYKFSGKWSHYTPNTETHIYLKPDETYSDNYDASYGGQFHDQGGFQTGHWGATGQDSGQGGWSVQGTLKRGQITLTDTQGNRTVYPYQVHVKDGETYWGEYFFNGNLYAVEYIYR